MSITVPFQTIQFSISTHEFISIGPIERALSGTTTPSQSGPRSNGNEEVIHIPQSSSIPGASPSDCLVSYGGSPTPQQRCNRCILLPQPTGQSNWRETDYHQAALTLCLDLHIHYHR